MWLLGGGYSWGPSQRRLTPLLKRPGTGFWPLPLLQDRESSAVGYTGLPRTEPCGYSDLGLLDSRTAKDVFFLLSFMSYTVCGILL